MSAGNCIGTFIVCRDSKSERARNCTSLRWYRRFSKLDRGRPKVEHATISQQIHSPIAEPNAAITQDVPISIGQRRYVQQKALAAAVSRPQKFCEAKEKFGGVVGNTSQQRIIIRTLAEVRWSILGASVSMSFLNAIESTVTNGPMQVIRS